MAKTKKRSFNPLQADPSRTSLLRERFSADVLRRIRRVERELVNLIVKEDALGIKPNKLNAFVSRMTVNERWKFLSNPNKLKAFQDWLRRRLGQTLLEEFKDLEDGYWKAYIEEGYRKGAGRAFTDVRKESLHTGRSLDFYRGTKDEFLRSSFAQPESVEKVKLLASRVFTDLKNVTESIATKLSRKLTDGLVQGANPRKIAKTLVDDLRFDKNRADVIARTEIIRAHSEGQLDAMKRLGVQHVGVAVEWNTAGDDRVCPLCRPLDGVVLAISEAHGLIPRHPRCRCAFLPANVGESAVSQLRGKSKVDSAISKSIEAEGGKKKTLAQKRKDSSWLGAETPIEKLRPKASVSPKDR